MKQIISSIYQIHGNSRNKEKKNEEKRLFALITSAFFILSACGTAAANQEDNSWSNVEKKKELVVATSGTLFPASYYNDQNELVGYDVDLAKEVAKRLNVKISFKEYNVDGQITSVSKRESDFAANDFGITKEREKNSPFRDFQIFI